MESRFDFTNNNSNIVYGEDNFSFYLQRPSENTWNAIKASSASTESMIYRNSVPPPIEEGGNIADSLLVMVLFSSIYIVYNVRKRSFRKGLATNRVS